MSYQFEKCAITSINSNENLYNFLECSFNNANNPEIDYPFIFRSFRERILATKFMQKLILEGHNIFELYCKQLEIDYNNRVAADLFAEINGVNCAIEIKYRNTYSYQRLDDAGGFIFEENKYNKLLRLQRRTGFNLFYLNIDMDLNYFMFPVGREDVKNYEFGSINADKTTAIRSGIRQDKKGFFIPSKYSIMSGKLNPEIERYLTPEFFRHFLNKKDINYNIEIFNLTI